MLEDEIKFKIQLEKRIKNKYIKIKRMRKTLI
jgi:hypothetical protein